MVELDITQIATQNEDAFDDLMVTVAASQGRLSLFLAVCDDAVFREDIIQRYEAEFAPEIPPFRVQLDREEPSLRQALAAVVAKESCLQGSDRGLVTVLGADALLPFVLGSEQRSQQDLFLGYLQWTRESLLAFQFPIVLWVSSRLLAAVGREAPDFWGWRKDVFRFQSLPRSVVVQAKGIELPQFESAAEDGDELPIEELLRLVEEREQQENAQDDPLLATLYFRLGMAYKKQADRSGSSTHKGSMTEAISWFSKAMQLQIKQDQNQSALMTTLNDLAELYRMQGKYGKAEPLYLQALDIGKKVLSEDHMDTAIVLNNLALLYYTQKKYEQAKPLFLQSLKIRKRILEDGDPDIATSLNNLALLHYMRGDYEQAETFFLQALKLWKEASEKNNLQFATGLNNLALLYYVQDRYEQAEHFIVQALDIRKGLLHEDHPDVAISLGSLSALYQAQEKYEQAELLLIQALKIVHRSLAEYHPDTQVLHDRFSKLIQKAHQANLAHTLSDHPLTQSLLQQIREEAQDNAQVSAQNFSQNSGTSTDDLLKIIANLRQTAAQFPTEQQEDLLIEIDDVEEQIQKPEAERSLPRIKKRLTALLTAATLATGTVAAANELADEVIDLGEKVGIELALPGSPES